MVSEREIFSLALKAARAGGKALSLNYKKEKILGEKGGVSYEVVTTADFASEKAVFPILKRAKVPILSEETKRDTEIPEKGFCFAVDPLDGTVNYTLRIPFFCISVGILKDRVPIGGAILNPATGELFSSYSGKGAYLNGKRISVSRNTDLSKTLINHCHRQGPEEIARISALHERLKNAGRDFRRLGSGALDLAWVGAGRNDAFFTIGYGGLWDVVAGVAFVREAGGLVTDFAGKEWTINEKNLLVSNNREILDKLKTLLFIKN